MKCDYQFHITISIAYLVLVLLTYPKELLLALNIAL